MRTQHLINIQISTDLTDPKDFVEYWSGLYDYPQEEKYNQHLSTALENKDSFQKLLEWKNGTGDGISETKQALIEEFWSKREELMELRRDFHLGDFEIAFKPAVNATIWKIFLLHLTNPKEFPIYDQHVYRFFQYQETSAIKETPSNNTAVWFSYMNDYQPWFNKLKTEHSLDPKQMDEAFFAFGKTLKQLKPILYPDQDKILPPQ